MAKRKFSLILQLALLLIVICFSVEVRAQDNNDGENEGASNEEAAVDDKEAEEEKSQDTVVIEEKNDEFTSAVVTNDAIGSAVYYVFYLIWYFGCFNMAAMLYGEETDQPAVRQLCLLGIHTELTHTFTLNYDDVVIP
mmetsp:Transcript_3689/g.4218  ORF Transcript_3689/g.4218 Transcript_3689/m.4218 type:complete len:138 (-) Transcript_3689:113-526(-)|eukprot:CAMPEP_0170471212 /NCGR_PEP_ID=MMETSP0123-20130129/13489_1 /TAXON_ID=182087 /ORGANISM="Favella ehrenbergii, Strain Fehren 1" /LENGTH=137 /DNA_ID=CAMNT_0010738749 /DNA_START=21 /DNA_END=434 /DNA_ORIENTATION=+